MQSWNIDLILVTLIVLKFLIPFIDFSLMHPLNMNLISIAEEVSNFDKSKFINSLQSKKIPIIFIALLVIKLLIPIIFCNLIHPLNINPISVTLEVSNLDKSKVSNSLHS